MATHILGITAYHGDSAAALLRDGEIVAAAREESFSRRQGDSAFPAAAIEYCLHEELLSPGAIDLVVFCDALQRGGGLRSLVTALRRTQLQVMVRRELAALIGSGHHSIPPLALISYPMAATEFAGFSDNVPAMAGRPSSADGAVGAALYGWHQHLGNVRRTPQRVSPWLGPWFGSESIGSWLDEFGVTYRRLETDLLVELVAKQLVGGATVGWFQGRQEFSAHSLGSRSVLMAPSLSALRTHCEFQQAGTGRAPLLLTLDAGIARSWLQQPAQESVLAFCHRFFADIPLHVVDGNAQPRLHQLLARAALEGLPLLASIDFHSEDEPIVATPVEAYRCAMRQELDCLVIEDLLLLKTQQPLWEERSR